MPILDKETLSTAFVLATYFSVISSIGVFTFIIFRSKRYKTRNPQSNNHLAYFWTAALGWSLFTVNLFTLNKNGLDRLSLNLTVFNFVVSTFFLLAASRQTQTYSKPWHAALLVHAAAGGLALWAPDLPAITVIFGLYALIAYSAIAVASIRRGRQEVNLGYGIIGGAALPVAAAGAFGVFAGISGTLLNASFTASFAVSAADFILVGAGLLTAMLIEKQGQLAEVAMRDSLTGLLNRRGTKAMLHVTLETARRTRKWLSVIAIDIDHFKRINDRYGHDQGDLVLTEIANLIRVHARGSDLCCRFGGEEFVIICPDTSQDAAAGLAERLRANIERHDLKAEESQLRVTASFGVAALLAPIDIEDVLKDADKALYQAKQTGRNRVCLAPSPEASTV